MNAQEKIQRCKMRLILARPWWASLLLHLKVAEMPPAVAAICPTMATDGVHLFYHKPFVDSLSLPECEGVLCHEVGHCALLHITRCGGRDKERWNIAADRAVNALLEADGITLPKGTQPAAPLDKTAEEIYDEIDESETLSAKLRDLLAAAAAESGETPQSIERRWRSAVAQAAGLAPGALQRELDKAHAPEVPWQDLLAQFVTAYVKSDDRTWTRLARRLPYQVAGRKREPQVTIGVAIDTSGSVDGALLAKFVSETRAILELNGVSAFVCSADAAVGTFLEPGEEWPVSLLGRGGTDFRPALARFESLDEVAAIVYFTDGMGTFPAGCSKPVLWALSQHCNVPFGESIHLK